MNQHPENPFWAAMLSNPVDSLPRLVFADWLEENGEIERGELLRYTHGFSSVGDGVGGVGGGGGVGGVGGGGGGDGGVGVGAGGGIGGGGAGIGIGVGAGAGIGGGVLFYGSFVMKNGFYLTYFPTGYYPLVMVGYVKVDGPELVLYGSRVVANSGVGADWAGLASIGPTRATLYLAAKHEVRIPRQCVVYLLDISKWEKELPEAIKAAEKDFLES